MGLKMIVLTKLPRLFGALILLIFVAACDNNDSSDPSGPVDTDQDGVPDNLDAFPNDFNESADSDGDGVGDRRDVFPNDASESGDGDLDGTGDNADNCPAVYNPDQADADVNGAGDACDAITTTYAFTNDTYEAGSNSVSYTGQTARQMLILGLVDSLNALTERPGESVAITDELNIFIYGEGIDSVAHGRTAKGGEPVIPGPTYGDISSGKNLHKKIAGGTPAGEGETGRLIGDEFFGWQDGLDATPLPLELVDLWISRTAAQASDGTSPTVAVVGNPAAPVSNVTIDAHGRNYRQLLQKFLLGAVNFSQGTNDYFQSNFSEQVALREGPTKNYTEAEHNYDEAFGYYGAARDILDYTDLEARAKSGRDAYKNGYHDSNGDGSIDLTSEFVLGHAQNCAKRDVGSAGAANPTDLSSEVMHAFLAGRTIIAAGSAAGSLTDAQLTALNAHIVTASKAWEKCIAATAIHYVKDVLEDMDGFTADGEFADVANFTDLAKHWGELKGFALSLQFSPYSPFRDGTVDGITLDDLKALLANLGDAPVLADGSQNGVAPSGTAAAAISAYRSKLESVRNILTTAYGFDTEVAQNW